MRKAYNINHKERRIKNSEYQKKNKGTINAIQAQRRAAKLKATPKWVDRKKLKEIYINCPDGFHVDHVVPFKERKFVDYTFLGIYNI